MKNSKSIPVSGSVVNEYQGLPLLFPGEQRNLVDKITTQCPHIYMLIEYLSKILPDDNQPANFRQTNRKPGSFPTCLHKKLQNSAFANEFDKGQDGLCQFK